MNTTKLSALKLNQNGTELFLTSMDVRDLIKMTKVDTWKPEKIGEKDQGYQREPTLNRCLKVATYMRKNKDALLPTSILINSREKLQFKSNGDKFGELLIKEKDWPLYIIDGQHRVKGLEQAIMEGNEEVENFQLPIAIINNVDRDTEVKHFYVINTYQKNVRSDVYERLIHRLQESDPQFVNDALGSRSWKLRAIDITNSLCDGDSQNPWSKRIRKPNEQKTPMNIATEVSFTTSLGLILNERIFFGKSDDFITKVLINYWKAIELLIPDTFKEPREYVIQKTPGMFALHELFTNIFLLCNGDYSINNIKEILSKSFAFRKSDFWKSGRGENSASSFTGRKGFNVLYKMILHSLNREES